MNIKGLSFRAITALVGFGLALVGGDLLVRFASPQPYMYPRYKFSEQYGHLLFENERIVDGLPGSYEFHYTTNEFGYRGKIVPVSDLGGRPSLVVLGDSYAFGKGVNDGEEFPAVMQQLLGPDYGVINLSVIGFGLTQEIRTFYDCGAQYKPQIVILQFCKNDPEDNLLNPVTIIQDGRFVFRNTINTASLQIQTLISNSLIQKSQLYNFIRLRVLIPLYDAFIWKPANSDLKPPPHVLTANQENHGVNVSDPEVSPPERNYNELLETFAKDLKNRGIRLLLISVNGEVEGFPAIASTVHMLDQQGFLKYVDVRPWFSGVTGYDSPEGHVWGKKGHRILGENLARIVRDRP